MNQKLKKKKKSYFQNFSWFQFYVFTLCMIMLCFIAPTDLLCWLKSRVRGFLWKLLSFHTEMISALFLWGIVLLRGELRKYAKNSNFENFESALYSTSGSMAVHLMTTLKFMTHVRGNCTPNQDWICFVSYISKLSTLVTKYGHSEANFLRNSK